MINKFEFVTAKIEIEGKEVELEACGDIDESGTVFIDELYYKCEDKIYSDNMKDLLNIKFVYDKIACLYDLIVHVEMSLNMRWELVQLYNPTKSWYSDNYPKGSEKLDNLILKTMELVSKKFHARGKKTGSNIEFAKAIEAYRLFLVSFPKSKKIKEINLLYAEAFFDAKLYRQAAKEYERAALLYPEGLERADIAYSAFLSHEILFSESEEKNIEIIKDAGEIINIYKSDFLKNNKLYQSIYTVADMYVQAGSLSKARDVLSMLVKGEESFIANEKIAELYLMENNLKGAEETYSKMQSKSKDSTLVEKISKLRYRIAEDHLKKKEYDDALDRFNSAFLADPGREIGKAALIQMGNIYILKKEQDGLLKIIKRLKRTYPSSDGPVSLLVRAGQGLEAEEPVKAAMFYEIASKIANSKEDSQELLLSAGLLHEKNKGYDKAEKIFNRYLQDENLFLKKKVDVIYRLGSMHLKNGKNKKAVETLHEIIKLKGQIDDRMIAKTELILLREKQDIYFNIKLTQPFEENLKKKNSLYDSFLEEYSNVAKYGIAEFLPEIFFQMGMIMENFRDSINQSERPEDLNKEELEEYKFLLEEKAYPYDDQAVQMYGQSIQIAGQQAVFDEWAQKSLMRLADLRPLLYKRKIMDNHMDPLFIYPEPVSKEFISQQEETEQINGTRAMMLFSEGLKELNENPENALKLYEEAIQLVPDKWELYYNLGVIYLKLNEAEKAVKEFDKALKHKGPLEKMYHALGAAYLSYEDKSKAFRTFKKTLSYGKSKATLINMASAYQYMGQVKMAIKYYDEAENLVPLNKILHYNRGTLLYQMGKYKEAKEEFDKANEIINEENKLLFYQALTFFKLGKFKVSLELFQKITENNPDDSALYKNMGIIYEIYLGNLDKALENYKTYIDKTGDDENIVRVWINVVEDRLNKAARRRNQEEMPLQ